MHASSEFSCAPSARRDAAGLLNACVVLFSLFLASTLFGLPMATILVKEGGLDTFGVGVVMTVGLVSPILCPIATNLGVWLGRKMGVDTVLVLSALAGTGAATHWFLIGCRSVPVLAVSFGATCLAIAGLFALVTERMIERTGTGFARCRIAGSVGFAAAGFISDLHPSPIFASSLCFSVLIPAAWLSTANKPNASGERTKQPEQCLHINRNVPGVAAVWIGSAVLAAVARPFVSMSHIFLDSIALAPGSCLALSVAAEALLLELFSRSSQSPRVWFPLGFMAFTLIYAGFLIGCLVPGAFWLILMMLPLQGMNCVVESMAQELVEHRRSNAQARLGAVKTLGGVVGMVGVTALGTTGPRLWVAALFASLVSTVAFVVFFRAEEFADDRI